MPQRKTRIDLDPRVGFGLGLRVLGLSLRQASLGAASAALLATTVGCSSAPESIVPARSLTNGALVLGAVSDDLDATRLDATLGAARTPEMREVESAEYWVWDRQREFNGRPLNTYRATTITRERRVR